MMDAGARAPEESPHEVILVGRDMRVFNLRSYLYPLSISTHPPAVLQIRRLDLSYNLLVVLKGLSLISSTLQELVLDNNHLETLELTRPFPCLYTLSLNKNKILDGSRLLRELRARAPALEYLSLLVNPMTPDQLSSESVVEEDYLQHRLRVLHSLHHLRFLDHRPVSPEERVQSLKIHIPLSPLPPTNLHKYYRGSIKVKDGRSTSTTEDGDGGQLLEPFQVWHCDGGGDLRSDLVHPGSNPDLDPDLLHGPLSKKMNGRIGRKRFKYTGKNSEGNRFIRDSDL